MDWIIPFVIQEITVYEPNKLVCSWIWSSLSILRLCLKMKTPEWSKCSMYTHYCKHWEYNYHGKCIKNDWMITLTDEWWHGTNLTELSKPILPFLSTQLWIKKCSQLCQPESASPRQQWSQVSSWHIQMRRSVRDIKMVWSRKTFLGNEKGIVKESFFENL